MTNTPTIAERYVLAATTSDLRVRSHATGAADVIIASGFSQRQIGAALERLLSNYDATTGQPERLQAWPLVVKVLTARTKHMDAPVETVLRWWLDQRCQTCQGTKWQTITGTNRLGAKACKTCQGSGLAPCPGGEGAKWLANWMDSCRAMHMAALKGRLGKMHGRTP